MFVVYSFVLCIVPLALLRYIYQKRIAHKARRSAVHRHGCDRPQQYPHRDRSGYDLVKDRIKAFASGEGQKIYERHFQKHGKTFKEYFWFQKTITTMEPANVQHVLDTATQDFTKRESTTRKAIIGKLLGRGIHTTDDGPEWRFSKEFIKPIFTPGELADLTIISKHVDRLIDALPQDTSIFDMQPFLQKMFLDIESETLLGESLNALSNEPPPETSTFLQNWNRASNGFARYRYAPRLFYLQSLLFPQNEYGKACAGLHQFIDRRVKRVLDMTDPTISPPNQRTFAEKADKRKRYVFINELAQRIRDPVKLRCEVANVFLVARENIAMVTANALFHLARNPSLWKDLRAVALDIADQPLTSELLKSLDAFHNVYNETLRLQGPAIMIFRTAINDTILPTGGGPDGRAPIFMEKGTQFVCNNWSMHHDPSIWGADAHLFRPQRWVERKKQQQSRWDFIPFGGGQRVCPARHQVYLHFAYVMVRLVRAFEAIGNGDPVAEYVPDFKFTVESKNGVRISLVPAEA